MFIIIIIIIIIITKFLVVKLCSSRRQDFSCRRASPVSLWQPSLLFLKQSCQNQTITVYDSSTVDRSITLCRLRVLLLLSVDVTLQTRRWGTAAGYKKCRPTCAPSRQVDSYSSCSSSAPRRSRRSPAVRASNRKPSHPAVGRYASDGLVVRLPDESGRAVRCVQPLSGRPVAVVRPTRFETLHNTRVAHPIILHLQRWTLVSLQN